MRPVLEQTAGMSWESRARTQIQAAEVASVGKRGSEGHGHCLEASVQTPA